MDESCRRNMPILSPCASGGSTRRSAALAMRILDFTWMLHAFCALMIYGAGKTSRLRVTGIGGIGWYCNVTLREMVGGTRTA